MTNIFAILFFCHRRFVCLLCRTMDGRWDFTAGLPDLSGPSGTPYQDMLNMPGFEEPVQPASTHAFEPGSRQGGSGKPCKKTVSRPKQNNFSIEEDKNLVSSWLNVSLDPVKGDVSKLIVLCCKHLRALTLSS